MINKIMRMLVRICGVALVFGAVFGYSQVVYAHAPQTVDVSYNASSQTLTVTITHSSPSTGYHYIKSVEIKKNGALVSNNTYDSQPDPKTFTYTYKLSAAENDKVEVTTTCSLWGRKATAIEINLKP